MYVCSYKINTERFMSAFVNTTLVQDKSDTMIIMYYGIHDSCNIGYAPLSCEINTIVINYIA